MNEKSVAKPSIFAKMQNLKTFSAKNPADLVQKYVFDETQNLPFIFKVRFKQNAVRWIEKNFTEIEEKLLRYGAVLLRGFQIKTADEFGLAIKLFGAALPYKERSSPRTTAGENIYTSTEYPPDQEIFFHNENSYAHKFPRRLFFFCQTEPQKDGATPLSDVRKVLAFLPAEIVEKFERKGVLYVRNFGEEIGLSWREVFQTECRSEVEKICADGGYTAEWRGQQLRTQRIGLAVTEHPLTKEKVWFNHAAFFHVSTHPPEIRDALLSQFAPKDLPHNTFYGDGEPIETEVLEVLRESYQRASVTFAWRESDLLIVDNILTAHARTPFSGVRRILVGMTN